MEEHIDQRQIVDFVVDFKSAAFIDSDGLEALLWMKRRCEDLFGRIKLVESRRKLPEDSGDHPARSSL